jgi:hypothetical protein
MEDVRLDCGSVLHDAVQDMDRFPGAAGDEQRDIVVRDMVIGDATIGTVTYMLGAQEVVFPKRNVRAIGDRRTASAQTFGKAKRLSRR